MLRENLALNRTPSLSRSLQHKNPEKPSSKVFFLKYFKKTGFLPLFERDSEGTFFENLQIPRKDVIIKRELRTQIPSQKEKL